MISLSASWVSDRFRAFVGSCLYMTGYNNKEKGKKFILVLPMGIRLRRNRAGHTCGMLVNPKIETDRRSPGDKDITCRAEQMFERHDAGFGMSLSVKTADNRQVTETFPDRGRTDAKET
jgi:hypothetical protein